MSRFTYVELFAGIGGFKSALDTLGGRCVFASEIDKYAQQSYKAIYGDSGELHGDITKIAAADIPDHDVLVGGFPCFPAGQRIITDKGFVNIENIRKGDVVLTHTGNYREVVVPMRKLYSGDMYEIIPKYYRIPIKTTSEHPFFTRRGWVTAENLTTEDYVGFPLNKREELPEQFEYQRSVNGTTVVDVTSKLPFESEDFWRLIGYWLAEGWTQDVRKRPQGKRNAYRLVFAANDNKLAYVTSLLNRLGVKYNVTEERTCYKVHVISTEYWTFVKQFTTGKTASDKLLPEFVQNLPVNLCCSLVEGYFTGDGCNNAGYTQLSSTSLPLLEGFQRLLLKTDKRLYSLTLGNRAGTSVIEGREVSTKDCYYLRGGNEQGGCVEFTEDYVFFKVDVITKESVNNVPVYNFEVDVDNSYCLPLITVHNCQAFSVAGQRKGFEDTRGTLFFEIARIAAEKKPRLLLLENVKGLLSHDGGNTFEVMCRTLNEIGYAIDFRVLNSKYFGVPQNRERIFIVADRDAAHEPWTDVKGNDVVTKAKRKANAWGVRSFNFDWPADGVVTTRLRDVLETNVDEKYYLSEEKTAKLVAQLREKELTILRERTPKDINAIYSPDILTKNQNGTRIKPADEVMCALTVQDRHGIIEPIIEKVGHLPSDSGQTGAVYGADGIAPTCLNQHGNAVTKVAVNCVGNVNPSGNGMNGSVYDSVGLAPTLTTNKGEGTKILLNDVPTWIPKPDDINRTIRTGGKGSLSDKHNCDYIAEEVRPTRYRIRKLTPLECWRLQGFSDAAHETAKLAGVSDSQRYKQAGNAVTVNVISAIGKQLVTLLDKPSSLIARLERKLTEVSE